MFIIDFKPFKIEEREFINSFFHVHHYEGIDCSFNTLFLWQEAYHTQWAVEENILFVRAGEGENTFFMPPFAGEGASFSRGMEIIHECLEREGKPFIIKAASPWVLEQIRAHCPNRYEFTADRDNWEYVYRTADMINLSGKKLRMKKNHLNGFLRQYGDYIYESITPENREDAWQGIEDWFERHGNIAEEKEALKRCFANWDALELKGAVIRIYGKVEAFTNGDLVNPRVAHIFFEKANPNIRGLYQAINRDFLMHEFAETEFVNREEDMGLPGLRQAKLEYNPDHFAEKYDVVVKDGGCF